MHLTQVVRSSVFSLAVVLLSLGVFGCSTTQEEPDPEPLTPSQAQRTYLEVMCPVNEAWYEVDLRVDTLRSARAIDPPDLDAHQQALIESLEEFARINEEAAEELTKSIPSMPEQSQQPLQQVSGILHDDAVEAQELADTQSVDELVQHEWPADASRTDTVQRTRDALGLNQDEAPSCDSL